MGTPFISITDLENYMGRSPLPDKAKIALDAACDEVRKVAEQDLDFVADDEVLLGSDGGETMLLPEMPVYAVESVEGPSGNVLVPGTDYVLDRETGALQTKKIGLKFLKGRQNYTVVYTHGYVSDSSVEGLPSDVQEWPSALRIVALQLAVRIYDQQLVKEETVGGYSATYSSDEAIVLTDRERDLVEKTIGVGRRR